MSAATLLKKLSKVGDPVAKRAYKEEIVKRFLSGFHPTMEYLVEGDYIWELQREELQVLMEEAKQKLIQLDEINLMCLPIWLCLGKSKHSSLWVWNMVTLNFAPCYDVCT